MLSKENCALLSSIVTKPFEVKQNTEPTPIIGNRYQKKAKVNPLDGQADWVRFKSECVLLKGAKR